MTLLYLKAFILNSDTTQSESFSCVCLSLFESHFRKDSLSTPGSNICHTHVRWSVCTERMPFSGKWRGSITGCTMPTWRKEEWSNSRESTPGTSRKCMGLDKGWVMTCEKGIQENVIQAFTSFLNGDMNEHKREKCCSLARNKHYNIKCS